MYDALARQRVRAQLEADKQERIRIAEEKKRIAAGAPLAAKPVPSKPVIVNGSYSEARMFVLTQVHF
jgi:hypothetical protein